MNGPWRLHELCRAAMTAAASGILCDAPTERATRSAFKFEERGALQLAGLGDMAAVFRPAEQYVVPSSSPVLIGRERELEFLRRTFDEARLGGKRLLAVMGELGIGKSALVTAFADELRSTAATVSLARAERDDRRTSLLPWRRVLASLLELLLIPRELSYWMPSSHVSRSIR